MKRHRRTRGFSLIELLVVMVIISVLMMIGVSIFGRTAAQSRRVAVDAFTAAVEQARTTAITRRKPVLLAVAPPLPGGTDQVTRFGLFEVNALPSRPGDLEARQLQRWQTAPDGVVFFGGKVEELRNLMDEEKVTLTWKDGENRASVHVFAFTPRGGLAWPTGSDSVSVKIGTGFYRDGQAVATKDGGTGTLRVGRVIARPWRLDG